MGIRSKPKQQSSPLPSTDEQHVNALIEKGGTVASAASASRNAIRPMLVQLRLSRDIIERIDRSRKLRTVPPSRHAWILEALLDKLKSE
jgi:hypothetical protein